MRKKKHIFKNWAEEERQKTELIKQSVGGWERNKEEMEEKIDYHCSYFKEI